MDARKKKEEHLLQEFLSDFSVTLLRHILAQWPHYIYLTEREEKKGPDKVFFSVGVVIKVSPLQNLTVMFHKLLGFNS